MKSTDCRQIFHPLFFVGSLLWLLLFIQFETPSFAQNQITPSAKPFLHALFTNHMVLQRDITAPIWGWTTPGEKVTVRLTGPGVLETTSTTTAGADGKWMTKLGPLKAGGPYSLVVSGPQQVTLQDVLVGDVWLCSGQSNMKMGMSMVATPGDIAAADHPKLRLFSVPYALAFSPSKNITSQWDLCTPQSLVAATDQWGGFSAVAYYFGKYLLEKYQVPIGLIHSSWGGSVVEAWVSGNSLKKTPEYAPAIRDLEAQAGSLPAENQNAPTVLFNGMIAPLVPFGIKGAIWYQGESNIGRHAEYAKILPLLIEDWRAHWNLGAFPFLIVQLPNMGPPAEQPGESQWASLREVQAQVASNLPNVGLAVTIDLGQADNIHPPRKEEVGVRLSLVARNLVYGEKVEASGPVYSGMKSEHNALRISFYHANGLAAKDGGKLTGFAIAGQDMRWVWADATIDGSDVLLSSPSVSKPTVAGYNWADNPNGNLTNATGLPAAPFRTDAR